MELLDEMLAAHGGVERWSRARTIRARGKTGGLLPRTRMPGNKLAEFEVTVDVTRPHSVLSPFPADGLRGVFTPDQVTIESDDGRTVEARRHPRRAFSGLSGVRRNLRWDALDTTYFAGYAMWNYLTAPFLLTWDGFGLREGAPWRHGRERWRRLEVAFPSTIPTHSDTQTFYVDAAGRLRRHDYTAEVVGGWAHAAHHLDAHREFDGLLFPTRRWVRPIGPGNRSLPGPTLVAVEVESVRVEFADG